MQLRMHSLGDEQSRRQYTAALSSYLAGVCPPATPFRCRPRRCVSAEARCL